MANPSNLYAEKIFSEHPIALWALDEEFSDGSHTDQISYIKNVNSFNGTRILAYGLEDNYGYYIASNLDNYYSKNSGIPMVYGASNITAIYGNTTIGQPSLVVPGCGFLNNSGKFQDLTLEFWIRINSNSSELQRIVGPVASTDGLYVEESFLILKVGNNVKSHFIGEWNRPMLVDIQSTHFGAALTINGEQVFYMEYEYPVTFPESRDGESEQDWIGFYAYDEGIPVIEIDAIAIYPYAVSSIVAKRRFVYGQGVVYPNNINSAYGGTATLIDYAFSNYSKNYNYPTISGWASGEIENLSVNGDFLSLPNYTLPTVVTSKTKSQWLSDLYSIQSDTTPRSFITLKPDDTYESGYIKFDSMNITSNPVKSIFGVFEPVVDGSGGTLFRIQNKFNRDYVDVSISPLDFGYQVLATSSISGVITELAGDDSVVLMIDAGFYDNNSDDGVNAGLYNTTSWDSTYNAERLLNIPFENSVAIGFNIDYLISTSTAQLSDFFNNPDDLAVYLGGTETEDDTFDGKIYGFSFADEYSTNIINSGTMPDTFDVNNGFLFSLNTSLADFVSTYTLISKKVVDQIVLDIGVRGYWQDYVPLSFLSKTVDDGSTALDMIQFNINYPRNGYLVSGTEDIATSDIFKSFISFQSIESNAQSDYELTVLPKDSGDVLPGDEWTNSRYEVLDNDVIYLPQGIDIDASAMTIRLEYLVNGIFQYPITIKSLELASQAYNKNSDTFIGSRFGTTITPYSDTSYNPYVIYKGSTPYLYMTDKTGIRLVGDFSATRGLRLNINDAKSESFNISSIQMSFKHIGDFKNGDMRIFEIVSKNNHLRFYLDQSDPHLSTIVCKSVDSLDVESNFTDIEFYINGHTGNTVSSNEWTILGIRFKKPEDFGYQNDRNNGINILGPLLFNNISYYRVSDTAVKQRTAKISWSLIKEDLENGAYDWEDWSTSRWIDIMFDKYEDIPSIDPEIIYKMYLGTNKIIAGAGEVGGLNMSGYQYVVYTNTSWQPEIVKPV